MDGPEGNDTQGRTPNTGLCIGEAQTLSQLVTASCGSGPAYKGMESVRMDWNTGRMGSSPHRFCQAPLLSKKPVAASTRNTPLPAKKSLTRSVHRAIYQSALTGMYERRVSGSDNRQGSIANLWRVWELRDRTDQELGMRIYRVDYRGQRELF